MRTLASHLQQSSNLSLIQPPGVPLPFNNFTDLQQWLPINMLLELIMMKRLAFIYLHGQIIWSLLISHLQTRQLSMLYSETISFMKVVNNMLHGTSLIKWKTGQSRSSVSETSFAFISIWYRLINDRFQVSPPNRKHQVPFRYCFVSFLLKCRKQMT